MQAATSHRTIARVMAAERTLEGAGVPIRRAFPTRALADLDPFLLLDQMGPLDIAPGRATGFPDHPHRGFETVTYVLEGEMEHRDSRGNHGRIGPGDVQWMTAGSGLVHSEMPGAELVRTGGRLHGFQLWVNLPRRDKMIPPHYQELAAARIPVARAPGVTARIIAGEALGQKGLIETHIPITYLHLTLAPGAEFVQPVPRGSNVFAYDIAEGRLTLFSRDGDAVRFSNDGTQPLDLLLIAGEPIGEPVARWGPFVMNTREELQQAAEDFRSGRMGTIG